ncbi:MAG: NfeD family protein [Clostridia bacterium]|nr:NfeD family protein [Clostridia bacterium]
MDYQISLCWLALVVIFAVIEGVTPQLVSIWFAGGALCALIVSLFGVPLWVDIAVFVGVSALLLLLTRPLIKKRWSAQTVRTNADAAIGQDAIVTSRIDNTEGTGLVNLGGQIWSARSENGTPISEGASVRVQRIEGVKLIVTEKEATS